MLIRHALTPLTVISLLGLGACTHAPSSAPDPALTSADPTAVEDSAPAPFLKGLSTREYVAVMRVAGCEDPRSDSAQCVMCPDSEPATVELFPGDFTEPGRRGVVVSSPACEPEPGGTPTTRLMLMEQDPEGVWSTAGAGRATHLTQCREAADLSGRSHLLCVARIERYGTTSTYHVHFGWAAGAPEPTQTTLVEVAERDDCERNYSVEHVIKGPTFEASAEGAPQLALEVITTMGPFTKALDECPEEGFEGPLEPTRTSRTMTNTFTFELTPEGPRERDGKGGYVSLGAEFEDLMEQ